MNNSNKMGRAFEYACIVTLETYLKENSAASLSVLIKKDRYYENCCDCFENLPFNVRGEMQNAANAFIPQLITLEPMLSAESMGVVRLEQLNDENGIAGDTRDIVITRGEGDLWEIVLSIKHNHQAVKHSRLAAHLDFGKQWVNCPVSNTYWEDITPIFDKLHRLRDYGVNWSDIKDKQDSVYLPLLSAFRKELLSLSRCYSNIPRDLVEYLVGKYDFYKVIAFDKLRKTNLFPFNLHGKLNMKAGKIKPQISIQKVPFPTRIISLELKPNSKTTLELYMDNGWQFSFRLHSASTKVETSLKFDIQLIGLPASVIMIECPWRQ